MSVIDVPGERPIPEAWRWYYYIHLCGPAGRDWLARYDEARGLDIAERLDRVVALCRRNRLPEAEPILAGCLDDLQAAERTAPPSVAAVIRRWYLSTAALVCYHQAQFSDAWRLLDLSAAAIRDSISREPFLIGMAAGCMEFAVHYARLARCERRWSDMQRHFALARAMYNDQVPLCALDDRSPIFVGDIYRFVASLTPHDEEEAASLALICDPRVMARGIEILIRRVEAVPDMVIPFN